MHGEKQNGNRGVYKEKSSNIDNYTSLHLFSKAVYCLGLETKTGFEAALEVVVWE